MSSGEIEKGTDICLATENKPQVLVITVITQQKYFHLAHSLSENIVMTW